MQEIGLESSILKEVLSGRKTHEGRLGKPKFLKIKVGDEIALREDLWDETTILESKHIDRRIIVNQVLYFASFDEMLGSLDFKQFIPTAKSAEEALSTYRKFYKMEDEHEFGVVAILFELK